MRKSKRKLLSLALTLAMGIMTLCNTILATASEIGINGKIINEGEGYSIVHDIVNYGINEYQDNITITNNSDKVIHNWSLKFNSPYSIHSIYNGEWQTYENGYESDTQLFKL